MLFSMSHVVPNAVRYWQWTMSAQTPFILLALASPLVASGQRERSGFLWATLVYAAKVIVC